MSRLVYACRFDVLGDDADVRVVIPQYEKWISERYLRAFKSKVKVDLAKATVSGALPDDHSLVLRSFVAERSASELEWVFPGEDKLLWRNVVRTAQIAGRCVVEHRVEIASAEYLVAPAFYSVGAPSVVRNICQQGVTVGDMSVLSVVRTFGTTRGVD